MDVELHVLPLAEAREPVAEEKQRVRLSPELGQGQRGSLCPLTCPRRPGMGLSESCSFWGAGICLSPKHLPTRAAQAPGPCVPSPLRTGLAVLLGDGQRRPPVLTPIPPCPVICVRPISPLDEFLEYVPSEVLTNLFDVRLREEAGVGD